ncbi:MAG: hypothetical protein ACKVQQ_16075 [Burkholderiales bacterium]
MKRLILTHTRAVTPDAIASLIADAKEDYDGPVTVAADMDLFEI